GSGRAGTPISSTKTIAKLFSSNSSIRFPSVLSPSLSSQRSSWSLTFSGSGAADFIQSVCFRGQATAEGSDGRLHGKAGRRHGGGLPRRVQASARRARRQGLRDAGARHAGAPRGLPRARARRERAGGG